MILRRATVAFAIGRWFLRRRMRSYLKEVLAWIESEGATPAGRARPTWRDWLGAAARVGVGVPLGAGRNVTTWT